MQTATESGQETDFGRHNTTKWHQKVNSMSKQVLSGENFWQYFSGWHLLTSHGVFYYQKCVITQAGSENKFAHHVGG